jgi:hypothetical protein
MAGLFESTGTDTNRIFFELDQFELAGEDRLEVRGRWFGVRGRRFVRPTLVLDADGQRRRALADLKHMPWFAEDGEPWEAAFSCGVDGAEVRRAELAVAPDIAVALPAPNGRRRRPTRIAVRSERRRGQAKHEEVRRDELGEARQEIDRLRAELEASNAARLESHGARDRAATERDEISAERDRIAAERDALVSAREQLQAALAAAQAERDDARAAVARARSERDEALGTYARLADARDQALKERAGALVERDEAMRSRDEAVRRREQAFGERDRALAELQAQRQAAQQAQAEREAEITARGAAMVMRNATRVAPARADWTIRAIAITVLVIAVLAALLIVRVV